MYTQKFHRCLFRYFDESDVKDKEVGERSVAVQSKLNDNQWIGDEASQSEIDAVDALIARYGMTDAEYLVKHADSESDLLRSADDLANVLRERKEAPHLEQTDENPLESNKELAGRLNTVLDKTTRKDDLLSCLFILAMIILIPALAVAVLLLAENTEYLFHSREMTVVNSAISQYKQESDIQILINAETHSQFVAQRLTDFLVQSDDSLLELRYQEISNIVERTKIKSVYYDERPRKAIATKKSSTCMKLSGSQVS